MGCLDRERRNLRCVPRYLTLDPRWRLDAKLKNEGIRIDSCDVTFLNFNINGRIANAANPAIDRALGAAQERLNKLLDFRPRGEALWASAHQPIKIQEGLWLQLNPERVLASPLALNGSNLSTAVGLVARPRIVSGEMPAASSPAPLPPLEIQPQSNAFHIALEGSLDYDTATEHLQRALVGRRYPFALKHKKFWLFGPDVVDQVFVKVTGARVYGSGDLAIVQLDVDEAVRGSLYLLGAPVYDTGTEVLRIDRLDYSVETRNELVRVADWLLHEEFLQNISSSARWKLSKPMGDLKTRTEAALNQTQGNVTLHGTLTSLRPIGVKADSNGFTVRAVADGKLAAELH